ncbi:hypothetical protein OVA10_11240 [Lelliottia sp. SL45]|uniref:hypothetical protein n=1 Tax=Lelliottia sp. SL45 TaxID=2994665 RepID=UPI00227548EE|nr:hypothetical protein [Lelliottia sp. SL45]MCY1698618.1 hypothetical protein [Lelliottia sp. SL45]
MRIEFIDKGAVGHMVISSPFWRVRRHFRAVDAALIESPCITWRNEGGFWVKRTILSGPIFPMFRTHKAAWREVNR